MEFCQGLREKKLIESNLEKVDRLRPTAKELGCSLAQLALAWCVRNEHVSTVITGATKREQVRQKSRSSLLHAIWHAQAGYAACCQG